MGTLQRTPKLHRPLLRSSGNRGDEGELSLHLHLEQTPGTSLAVQWVGL